MDGGKQSFDTVGQLKLLLDGRKASEERRDTRIRTTDGKRDKAKQGKWVGSGQTPYGYRKIGKREESMLVVHEEEAYWIREMYRMYVEEGLSLRKLAKRLDKENAPKTSRAYKRNANYWSPTTVRWILQNPIYKGKVIWKSKDPLSGEYDPIEIDLESDLVIVPPAIWAAAQERIDMNKILSKRNGKHDILLSGLIKCGHCGGSIRGRFEKECGLRYSCGNRGRPTYVYRCPNATKRVIGNHADTLVWEWMERLLTDEDYLDRGLREITEKIKTQEGSKRAKLEEIKHLIDEVEVKINRASSELLQHDDEIVLSALRKELKRMTAYHKSLVAEKYHVEAELSLSVSNAEVQHQIKVMAKQIHTKLPKLDCRSKRELMVLLSVEVILQGEPENRWLDVSCALPASQHEIEFSIL